MLHPNGKKIHYLKELSRFKFEHYIKPEYNYSQKKELIITGYSGSGKHDDLKAKEPKKSLYDILYNRMLSFYYGNGYLTKCSKSIIYFLDDFSRQIKIIEFSLDHLEIEGRPFVISDLAFKCFGEKDNDRLQAICYSIFEKCKKYLGIDPNLYQQKRNRELKSIDDYLNIKLKFRDRKHLIDYCSNLVEKKLVPRPQVEAFYFEIEKYY